MHVRRAAEADRSALAAMAARLQADPTRHVTYLASEAEVIAEEMVAEDDDWTAVSAVAEVDDGGAEPLGWLMGSVDAEMGRVWWIGPFVDVTGDDQWLTVADALYDAAHRLLPSAVHEEEFAPDARFVGLARFAAARGFATDPGSAVLVLADVTTIGPPTIAVRPVRPDDAAVATLHDELFANTHTTGATLVADGGADHVRLVHETDGELAGYVAVERQPGGEGYIDFLGVPPSFRRRGIGADLVRAGVAALRDLGCASAHLTVREANAGARSVYAGLGFEEERIIHPYRKGFTLP